MLKLHKILEISETFEEFITKVEKAGICIGKNAAETLLILMELWKDKIEHPDE